MMLKILWGIFSTVHLCSFVSVLGISHVSLLLSLPVILEGSHWATTRNIYPFQFLPKI